jgi:hypothetical protein
MKLVASTPVLLAAIIAAVVCLTSADAQMEHGGVRASPRALVQERGLKKGKKGKSDKGTKGTKKGSKKAGSATPTATPTPKPTPKPVAPPTNEQKPSNE